MAEYYVLDGLKIRQYLDKDKYDVTIRNVKYEFVPFLRFLASAEIVGPNAMALTRNGFIEWKNSSRKVHVDLTTEAEPICIKGVCNTMCNNYICIGSTPPKDRIRISKNDIVFYDIDHDKIIDLPFVDIQETDDSLVINFQKEYTNHGYYKVLIGIMADGKFVNFGSAFGLNLAVYHYPYLIEADLSKSVLLKIISKGTCYRAEGGLVLCYE